MQHPFEHDITALAYDLLDHVDGGEREALLEHLSGCDQCRAAYDSFRNEQVTVRDAIVSDARSGAAEAKALEATLAMLGTLEAPAQKRGRLLRLPAWLIIGEIAAVLLVSLGLFFLLKPDDTETDVIPVAEADRAPATIESGVAYVQNNGGEWKAAEAVPVDQWVKTGAETFSVQITGGPRAEFEPNSVFRISLQDGSQSQPVVFVLHGNGVIDTAGVSNDVLVRSGGTGFYTMPNARLSLACEGEAGQALRSWSTPSTVRARVVDGDVVLWTSDQPMGHLPLRRGEVVEWKNGDFKVSLDNEVELELLVGTQFFFSESNVVDGDKLRFLLPRLKEFEKRADVQHGYMERMRHDRVQLERTLVELEATLNLQQSVIIKEGLTLTLSTDGDALTLVVRDAKGSTTYVRKSVEDLKTAVPERIGEMLDDFKIKIDDKGKFDLGDVDAGGEGQKTVRIFARTNKPD